MADEFRHELLRAQTNDGTTSENADAEFRNRSSTTLSIRGIDRTIQYNSAANDETARSEISKAPTFQGSTNNSPFFTWVASLGISGGTDGAVVDDVAMTHMSGKRWGKGQLTLEPNESLFVNQDKSSGGTLVANYLIEYEFM